jgi:hypothetical protein
MAVPLGAGVGTRAHGSTGARNRCTSLDRLLPCVHMMTSTTGAVTPDPAMAGNKGTLTRDGVAGQATVATTHAPTKASDKATLMRLAREHRRLHRATLTSKRHRRALGLRNWWAWLRAGRQEGLPCVFLLGQELGQRPVAKLARKEVY